MKRKKAGSVAHYQPQSLARRHFLEFLGSTPLFLSHQLFRGGEVLPYHLSSREFQGQESREPTAEDSPSSSHDPQRNLGPVSFYLPPRLALMVGFIKDPQHKEYTLEQWAKNVGSDFDAHKLAARAKNAGMVEIIWYDKWINGLVFHKTQTTTFMTRRDFLADLAPACRKVGLKLITYFNIFYDGNPQFAKWACRDQRGRPIVFSSSWPSNLLSMYSPFRVKILQQVHELFVNYDVDGLWLDVPDFPTFSYDPWTRQAFTRVFGKSMEAASPKERRKFAIDSITQWTQEVAAYARKLRPSAVVTYNGADNPVGSGPRLALGMAQAIDYFSKELHTANSQEEYVPILNEYSKPVEAGYLVSDTWFSPIKNEFVRTSKSEDEVDWTLASVAGNGLNIYFAITPAHDGKLDEGTLQLLDLAGAWLGKRRAVLANTRGFNDVAIVLGTADPTDMTWPGGGDGYDADLIKLEESLRSTGYLTCRLMNCAREQRWNDIPACTRAAILPDRVNLTAEERVKVLEFVKNGGILMAFGRGAGLARSQRIPMIDKSFGVRNEGYLEPVDTRSFSAELKGKRAVLGPPLIYTHLEGARVMLWAYSRTEGAFPLITSNPVGEGKAYFCTAPESAFFGIKEMLGYLWGEIIGEPVWKLEGSLGSSTVTIREQSGRKVVNVVGDLNIREGPMDRYRSEYTQLSINSRVVSFQGATTIPEDRKLTVSANGIWKTVQVYPDPSVMLLLE